MPKFLDVTDTELAQDALGVEKAFNVRNYGAVGDGVTDDRAAIHAARDAAGVGGTLYFPPGTYLVNTVSPGSPGYKFGSGCLWANVEGQTWLLGSAELVLGLYAPTAPKRENLITVSAPDVTIRGGVLDLSAITPGVTETPINKTAAFSHGIAVWSGLVATGVSYGAHGSGAAGAVIDGVTIKNSPGHGVYIYNTSSVTVTGCTVKDFVHVGIFVQNGGGVSPFNIEKANISDFLIDGNRLESVWKSFAAPLFIGGNDMAGAGFQANNQRVRHARVTNNSCVIPRDIYPGQGSFWDGGSELHALGAFNLDDSVIAGNTLEGGVFGITTGYLRRVSITNNTMRGFRYFGVEVSGGAEDVAVVGNVIDSDGAGGPYNLTTGLQDPAGTLLTSGYGGVLVSPNYSPDIASNLIISGNTMSGFTSPAPAVGVSLGNDGDGITVSANVITGVGGTSTFTGVLFSGDNSNVAITGNSIDGASRTDSRGVSFFGKTQTGVSITGNNFVNCARAAFEPFVLTDGVFSDIRYTGNLVRNSGSGIRGDGMAAATRLVVETGSPVTSTATAGGITNLLREDSEVQRFTGTNTQNVRLPSVDIITGRRQTIINNSTGAVTVQSVNPVLETVAILPAGTSARFVALQNTPTTAAHWYVSADYTDARADLRVPAAAVAASDKATPVDADLVPLVDSAASNALKKLSWANLKATLAAYYDALTTTMSNKTLAAPALTGTSKVAQSGVIEVYNTADQATNFEKAMLRYNSNVVELLHTHGGTGNPRSMRVGLAATAGSTTLTRYLQIAGATPFVSLEWSSTGSTGNLNAVGAVSSLTASSGSQAAFAITPTVNQTSTAAYTMLLINPTETATGSGTKRLIDAQTGGTSRFTVDNTGLVTANVIAAAKTSVTTAAGTTTMTIASTQTQVFTGSTTQTVKLPTTSVVAGQQYTIINQSSGDVTVQSSGANTIATMTGGAAATAKLFVALQDTPTSDTHWRAI